MRKKKKSDLELTPERKQEILAWACKRTNEEITIRINQLIDRAIDDKLKKVEREDAKCESVALVTILKRRKDGD